MKTSYKRQCSCGEARVTIYAKNLRAQLLPALKLLAEANHGMTAKELSGYFEGKQREAIEDQFPQLRHWGLIRRDGQRNHVTHHGKAFINDDVKVPQYVFTVDDKPVTPPEDVDEVDMLYFSEACPPTEQTEVTRDAPQPIQQAMIA